jgi:Tfp pilus assembly protein PilF
MIMSILDTKYHNYSEEELDLLYSLGIFYLEAGHYRSAEMIFQGLTTVAPSFADGWLASAATFFMLGNFDQAKRHAHQAMRLNPHTHQVQLLYVTILLSQNELSEAGTLLGEIKEQIDTRMIQNPDQIRYFKAQLSRFEFAQLN